MRSSSSEKHSPAPRRCTTTPRRRHLACTHGGFGSAAGPVNLATRDAGRRPNGWVAWRLVAGGWWVVVTAVGFLAGAVADR